MSEASATLHEPPDRLGTPTIELHRALVSLQEELEAVDWYRQRADATDDEPLRQILLHHMREEIEHACMLFEWLRRRDNDFAAHIATYLNSEEPIAAIEEHSLPRPPISRDQPRDAPIVQTSHGAAETFTVGTLKE